MAGKDKHLDRLHIDESDRAGGKSRGGIWLLGIALILVIISVFAWRSLGGAEPKDPPDPATQIAPEPEPAGQRTVLNASGYVTARRKATVSSKLTGRVTAVLFEEGSTVQKGQVLARLDDSELNAQLQLARASQRAARSLLAETQALAKDARRQLARTQQLAKDGVVGQAALDTAATTLDALLARLANQEEQIRVAGQQVALVETRLEDTVIRAPFDGVAISKDAQPGEMVSPISAGGGYTRTGVCTLVDMNSLEIEVDVGESYIGRIRPEQPVLAALDAYPDWKIPSRVITIVPTADRQRATVRVRIAFETLDARILPDMGVRVTFLAGETEAGDEGS